MRGTVPVKAASAVGATWAIVIFAVVWGSAPRSPSDDGVRSPPVVRSPVPRGEGPYALRFLPHPERWAVSSSRYHASVARDGELLVTRPSGPALTVRTTAVSRGASVAAVSEGEAHLDIEGVVRIPRGPSTEVLRATPSGVAQRWLVPEEPPGHGPLTVTVAVEGPAPGVAGPEGVRFAHARGAMVYGAATWVDAGGRRTSLTQHVEGSTIIIDVPAALLAESDYPAVLDPVVGPEQAVDAPVFEPQDGRQEWPAIASDGSRFLAAWQDYDLGAITVSLLDVTGEPVDAPSVSLSPRVMGQPDVVFDGTHYVVAWASGQRIFMSRVTPDGQVVDDPAVEAFTGDGTYGPYWLHLAHGAGRYLVTVQVFSQIGAPPVNAFLFDEDFQLVAGPTFLVDTEGGSGLADVVFDGQRFVAAWWWSPPFTSDPGSVGGVLLDPVTMAPTPLSGMIADGTATPLEEVPALAPVPGGVLVAWTDTRTGSLDVRSRLIQSNGQLSPEQVVIGTDADEAVATMTAVGGALLVAYRDPGGGTAFVPLSSLGAPLSPPVLAPFGGSQHRLAATATQGLIVFTEDEDVAVYPVAGDGGGVGPPVTVSIQANAQRKPAAAAVGAENLITWLDERGGSRELRAVLTDPEGQPLEPSRSVFGSMGTFDTVAVATDGSRWLLARSTAAAVELLFVPPFDGAVPVALDDVYGVSDAVHDGDTFLLFEEQGLGLCRGVCTYFALLHAHRVDATGSKLASFEVDPTERAERPRAVAVDGGALVVWQTTPDAIDDGEIMAAFLPHGAPPEPPFAITATPGLQSEPAVAFDGSQLLVVWRDQRTGGSEIRGRRLLPDGTFLDAEPIVISSVIASVAPEVAWTDDGHSFLVTWRGNAAGAPEEVYGAWVTRDGEVLDFPGVPLTVSESPVARHTIEAQGDGRVLLTYERFVHELRSERVLTRVVSSGVLDGGACVLDGDCASRSCEDGRCCLGRCGSCETCDGDTKGQCVPVTGSDDDSCFGAVTCDADGACKKAPGQPCEGEDECASGFCIEGLCCDTGCEGVCDSCVVIPGTCVTKECGAYSCNEDKSCLTECDDSTDCALGFQCTADKSCEAEAAPTLVGQSCGCRVPGASSDEERLGPWLALIAALALGRRRQERGGDARRSRGRCDRDGRRRARRSRARTRSPRAARSA